MFRRVVRDNIINIVSISVEKLDIIPAESLLRGPHAQSLLLPNDVYIYIQKKMYKHEIYIYINSVLKGGQGHQTTGWL